MRIFLYEFMTGGGMLERDRGALPSSSLLAEGSAMLRTLATDLCDLSHLQLWIQQDGRLGNIVSSGSCRVSKVSSSAEATDSYRRLVAEADHTIIVAPEFDDILLNQCLVAESISKQSLLSPDSEFIRIAADKQVTADRLNAANVPVPRGSLMDALSDDISFPIVVKPRDGAGSQDVRLISNGDELSKLARSYGAMRVEQLIDGVAASVAILCGPKQHFALPACRQNLSSDGRFCYFGGELPLDGDLDQRARDLAMRAIQALPPTMGYVGVDLVMGDATDGTGDYVIEINPRLTTSYLGLRAAARTNLAAAMLSVAQGDACEPSFSNEPVKFSANGGVDALQRNR